MRNIAAYNGNNIATARIAKYEAERDKLDKRIILSTCQPSI